MRPMTKVLEEISKTLNPKVKSETPAPSDISRDRPFVEFTILNARILQFALRFEAVWTTGVKSLAEDLVAVLVGLAVVSCSNVPFTGRG